jgi:hypothetical protein
MGRQIKLITRRELTSVIRLRYESADRSSKKTVLDEFVKVTGYHRKRNSDLNHGNRRPAEAAGWFPHFHQT